jgi:hypothetical protein
MIGMITYQLEPLPSLQDFPLEEQTASLKSLLAICQRQQEALISQAELLSLQSEQLQQLRDEISRLKGGNQRPKIKPSNLEQGRKGRGRRGSSGKRGKNKRQKTRTLEIHHEKVLEPEIIPEGYRFKGYRDYVVQELEIKANNTLYRRARYETKEGAQIIGNLPAGISGHFGPILRAYILDQHYKQHVPQGLILGQLLGFGIQISEGQINHIITEDHECFHQEKAEILAAGLEVSSYINTDDTGARHKGKNGYCTHIGNELFAWFSSTESKSRINFLKLLQAGSSIYTVDEVSRSYMLAHKLPKQILDLLASDITIASEDSWYEHLELIGIISKSHQRIVSEGALVGTLVNSGISADLVIVSDDAGQFNVKGFLNALCWIHAERNINTIIPFSDSNREAQECVQDQIWTFYNDLKAFKESPDEEQKNALSKRFDGIFTQKTCFQTLNLALNRIYNNKEELLLVLQRPEIPLHNNLSENDIRDYVKKRKISANTRSDNGRQARDTFLSLKKTCQKLGITFWDYLLDRIGKIGKIPLLSSLIREAASSCSLSSFAPG